MNATATRTYNPLPFTDLEPKRFEDLVRQLLYDFRPWRRLEATGRSGADDGFDARALEIVEPSTPKSLEDGEDEDEAIAAAWDTDRLWLVQCKRERAIGPGKLKSYLAEIRLSPDEKLHGIVFAAACDFSKASRDAFLAWCREQGINEAYIWGKGEIEDLLFQPKNDNLLFAYFGISLTIRRRSQATQIRAEIATKRKLKRTVLPSSADVLVRDPSADDYPYAPEGKRPDKWWVWRPEELTHAGLSMSFAWYYAYLDYETGAWDAADRVPYERGGHPWRVEDHELDQLEDVARGAWEGVPEENRAWMKVSGLIPIKNIIAIDEIGDDIFEGTHIYAPFVKNGTPFEGHWATLELVPYGANYGRRGVAPEPEKRIEKFPAETRKSSKGK